MSRVTRCRCTLRALRSGTFVRRTRRSGLRASRTTRRHRLRLRRNDSGFGLRGSGFAPLGSEARQRVFSRLFESLQIGAYVGTVGPDDSSTMAANPYLKLIFGHASETPEA